MITCVQTPKITGIYSTVHNTNFQTHCKLKNSSLPVVIELQCQCLSVVYIKFVKDNFQ